MCRLSTSYGTRSVPTTLELEPLFVCIVMGLDRAATIHGQPPNRARKGIGREFTRNSSRASISSREYVGIAESTGHGTTPTSKRQIVGATGAIVATDN